MLHSLLGMKTFGQATSSIAAGKEICNVVRIVATEDSRLYSFSFPGSLSSIG
jgi:hypothetical protein